MQQSNFIFGMILIAYIVFITVRGELQNYLDILRGAGSSSASGSAAGTSGLAALPALPALGSNSSVGPALFGTNTSAAPGNAGNALFPQSSISNTGTENFVAGTPFIDSGNPLPNPADYN